MGGRREAVRETRNRCQYMCTSNMFHMHDIAEPWVVDGKPCAKPWIDINVFTQKHMFSHAEPRTVPEEPREALSETENRCRGTLRNRGRNRGFLEEVLSEMLDRCLPAIF